MYETELKKLLPWLLVVLVSQRPTLKCSTLSRYPKKNNASGDVGRCLRLAPKSDSYSSMTILLSSALTKLLSNQRMLGGAASQNSQRGMYVGTKNQEI